MSDEAGDSGSLDRDVGSTPSRDTSGSARLGRQFVEPGKERGGLPDGAGSPGSTKRGARPMVTVRSKQSLAVSLAKRPDRVRGSAAKPSVWRRLMTAGLGGARLPPQPAITSMATGCG